MLLKEYLTEAGISQADFAAMIGMTQAAVSLYVSGVRTPRLPVAKKIIDATKGQVTIEDLIVGDSEEQVEMDI